MAKAKTQGLKWFHFLIYFALWLNAIVCALNGIMQLTGASYEILGIAAEDMYATYPTLKTVDLVFGVAYLVLRSSASSPVPVSHTLRKARLLC